MAENPSLRELHRELIALAERLARAQQEAATVEAIRALGNEHTEVTARIIIVGNLLFREQTAKIEAAMQAVRDGRAALDAAIEKIDRLNAFLKVISKFLGLVDKVIDTAKLL